jgi:hypothetical protein
MVLVSTDGQGVSEDSVLADDIYARDGNLESRHDVGGSREYDVGIEAFGIGTADVCFVVDGGNGGEVLSVVQRVVEVGRNPHKVHGGDYQTHLFIV